jgi:hypothetical protein
VICELPRIFDINLTDIFGPLTSLRSARAVQPCELASSARSVQRGDPLAQRNPYAALRCAVENTAFLSDTDTIRIAEAVSADYPRI